MCERSIRGTWVPAVYPEYCLSSCLLSLSLFLTLSSCLRPRPPFPLCSLAPHQLKWRDTVIHSRGNYRGSNSLASCKTRCIVTGFELSYEWQGKQKSLLQQRLLPTACCQIRCSVSLLCRHKFCKEGQFAIKSRWICQVVVSSSSSASCTDPSKRAYVSLHWYRDEGSDVFADLASTVASLLGVLLQEAPAVWDNWKASAAVTWQNASVLHQSETGGRSRKKTAKGRRAKQRAQKVIDRWKKKINKCWVKLSQSDPERQIEDMVQLFCWAGQLKTDWGRNKARRVAGRRWLPGCWDVMEWSASGEQESECWAPVAGSWDRLCPIVILMRSPRKLLGYFNI